MKAIIEKLDHLGNGIAYIDNKICFVPKCVPGDEVEIEIIRNTKNYLKARVLKLVKPSSERVQNFCPYFERCGGCQLQYLNYSKTLEYKKERVQNILAKVIHIPEIEIIANKFDKNYRNKIELKVVNGIIGFFENESHKIIQVDRCAIIKECINNFIEEIKLMNLSNADIMIRCNFNDELLISIATSDDVKLNLNNYPSKKVVGIIVNDKLVYGENHFIDMVDNHFFDVSYDAFFQVNSYINAKLFGIIRDSVKNAVVLDLYSGVGTLGIMASKTAQKVYSIECVPNAVLNAVKNAKMNNCHNIEFILGNVEDKIGFIQDKIDTVIVDPPRKGLDDFTLNKLLEFKPSKIVYISCDTQSLANNLKKLKEDYKATRFYIMDMFSYSYHTECVCVLELR